MAKSKEQKRMEAEYRSYLKIRRDARTQIEDYRHRIRVNECIREDPYGNPGREELYVPMNVKECLDNLWDKHDKAEDQANAVLEQLRAKFPKHYVF